MSADKNQQSDDGDLSWGPGAPAPKPVTELKKGLEAVREALRPDEKKPKGKK